MGAEAQINYEISFCVGAWLSFVVMLREFALCSWLSAAGEYVDMVKAGIIDPLKVIRTALVDAAR